MIIDLNNEHINTYYSKLKADLSLNIDDNLTSDEIPFTKEATFSPKPDFPQTLPEIEKLIGRVALKTDPVQFSIIQQNFNLLYVLHHLTQTEIDKEVVPKIEKIINSLDLEHFETTPGSLLPLLLAKSKEELLQNLALTCIKKGVNPSVPDEKGCVLLHHLAANERIDLIEQLFQQPIEIKSQLDWFKPNRNGDTPFDVLFIYQNWPMIDTLLRKQLVIPDREFLEKVGEKKVSWNIKHVHIRIMKKLFDVFFSHSAGIDSKDNTGDSLLRKFEQWDVPSQWIKELIIRGATPTNSDKEQEKLVEAILESRRNDKSSLVDIEILFKQKAVPAYNSFNPLPLLFNQYYANFNNKSFGPLSPLFNQKYLELYNKYYGIDENDIQKMNEIRRVIDPNSSAKECLKLLREGEALITKLEAAGAPIPEGFKKEFTQKVEEKKADLDKAVKYKKDMQKEDLKGFDFATNERNFRPFETFKGNPVDLMDLFESAIEKNQSDFLLKLLLNEHTLKEYEVISKSTFHFALDKIITDHSQGDSESPTKNVLEGGWIPDHSLVLLEALNKLKIPPSLTDFLPSEEVEQFSELVHSLQKGLSFIALNSFIKKEKYEKLIAQRLKNLKLNEVLPVPFGCKGHGTCLSFKLISPGKIRVSLYNTGEGLTENHPKLPHVAKYQTSISYKDVPLESLLKEGAFDFLEKRHNNSPEQMYQAFHHLCQGGVKEEASQNPHDYEQHQMQATCSAQCLMAFFREQLLSFPLGTELQRLGLYKAVKARTIMQITQDRMPWIDERIKEKAQIQLEKYKEDTQLLTQAQEKEEFESIKEKMCTYFKSHELDILSNALELMPSSTTLDRYISLRQMHTHLANHLRKNPKDLWDLGQLESINLDYTMRRLSKYTINQKTIGELFDQLKKKGEWDKILSNAVRFKGFFPTNEWLSLNIPKTPELTIEHPYVKLLADLFKNHPELIDTSPGLQALKNRGREDFIQVLKEAILVIDESLPK